MVSLLHTVLLGVELGFQGFRVRGDRVRDRDRVSGEESCYG